LFLSKLALGFPIESGQEKDSGPQYGGRPK
jgi:hypothetical protein